MYLILALKPPNDYVFVTEKKSWPDAQKHCREHYTDLASIQSEEVNKNLSGLIGDVSAWIGLSRDMWKWSDGSPFTFRAWQVGRPSNPRGKEDCTYYQNHGWADNWCSELKAFVCESGKKVQVVKITMKTSSPHEMEDPAIQAAMAEQIRQRLQNEGQQVSGVTWRRQADGKVFHEQKNKEAKKKQKNKSEL
ncbi:hypothetical protein ACEWY4_022378 [Coilia grayii]|uniref:C-type lectin domain-containing protein n=1 Tax=Coilia grayii TaxID=363190 RepID=A0ABD1J8A7_9TELE